MPRSLAGHLIVPALAALVASSSAFGGGAEVGERLRDAEASLNAGDVVIAREALSSLFADAGSYDEATRGRLLELMAAADRRMQFMPREDISLQNARIALERGDLRRADMHATEVMRSARASTEQRIAASDLMDKVAALRVDLEPMIPAALDRAVRDFIAGDFAESKAGFDSVRRSGVALSSQQQETLERYSHQILELEKTNGRPFEAEYVPMGVLKGTAAPVAVKTAAVVPAVMAMQDAPLPPGGGSGDDPFRDADRAEAQRLLAEAQIAFDEGRYSEAQSRLQQLNTIYRGSLSNAEVERVSSLLRQSRAFLAREGGGLVDRELDVIEIQRQQVTAEINELLRRSRESLNAGDVDDARRSASEARLRLRNGRDQNLFAEPEFERRSAEIDQLFRDIEATGEQLSRRESERLAGELRTERERREAEIQREKVARINENLDRIRSLQAERRYKDALQVVDEILFLDPNNPTALLMRDMLRDVVLYVGFDRTRREQQYSYAREFGEIEDLLVLPADIVDYPSDWPEISVRRGEVEAFTETPADRRVLAQLDTQSVPAQFSDARFEDVITFFAQITNLNVDVDWDSLARIGVRKDDLVSLELRQVSARVLLERVLEKVSFDDIERADWAVQDGIVVVASAQDLRRNRFIVVYDIRDLTFPLLNVATPPNINLGDLDGGGGGGGGGGLFDDDEEDEDLIGDPEELTEQLLTIITDNIDPQGWETGGGDTGIIRPFAGNLVITNTARNHRQIQGLLRQLRQVRNLQISLEGRFLQVSEDFFEQIGIDLDVYFNTNNNQVRSARDQLEFVTTDTTAAGFPSTPYALYPSFVVPRQGSPTVGQATIVVPDGGNFVTQDADFLIPAPNNLSVIPVEQNSLQQTTSLLEGSAFAQSILANNPALATAFTFLDDVQVDFLLEATQADRRSVSLASPRLTFINGNAAEIRVQRQEAYVQDVTPVVGPSSVAFNPQIGTAFDGLSFWSQGVVSSDRRYVTLNVIFGLSTIVDFANQPVFGAAGGGEGGGDPQQAGVSIQLPIITVTQVRTSVIVPDRGTVLLGGQRLASEVEVETGVPVLSKIPVLNRFFTNRATAKEQQTLMLLIKPTILIQDEMEDLAFPGLRDRLDTGFGM